MIVKGVTVLAPLLKAVCNLVYNKPVSLTPDFNHVSRNSSIVFVVRSLEQVSDHKCKNTNYIRCSGCY